MFIWLLLDSFSNWLLLFGFDNIIFWSFFYFHLFFLFLDRFRNIFFNSRLFFFHWFINNLLRLFGLLNWNLLRFWFLFRFLFGFLFWFLFRFLFGFLFGLLFRLLFWLLISFWCFNWNLLFLRLLCWFLFNLLLLDFWFFWLFFLDLWLFDWFLFLYLGLLNWNRSSFNWSSCFNFNWCSSSICIRLINDCWNLWNNDRSRLRLCRWLNLLRNISSISSWKTSHFLSWLRSRLLHFSSF